MKKKLCILLVFLLSVSLVSAGLLNEWIGQITGKAIKLQIGSNGNLIEDCKDSDGISKYLPGEVSKSGKVYKDGCVNYVFGSRTMSYVHEYFCDENNDAKEVFLDCPLTTTCVTDKDGRGFCKAMCIDKDHKDIYTKSTVVGYKDEAYSEIATISDRCISDTTLIETYYTDDGRVTSHYFKCPEGTYCNSEKARCESKEEIKVCTDSDRGYDLETKGLTKKGTQIWQDYCAVPVGNEIKAGNFLYYFVDSCEGDDCYLRESYCQKIIGRDSKVQTDFAKCQNGCKDGECLPAKAKTEKYCFDNDGGKIYNIKGTVKTNEGTFDDVCEGSVLLENYCDNEERNILKKECEFGCSNGACLEKSPIGAECVDSDGRDLYNPGMVKSSLEGTFKDFCIDDKNVIEFYCHDDQSVSKKAFECTIACKDGACVKQCYDSDGFDTNVGGYVKTIDGEFADVCSSKNMVIEFFCEGGEARKKESKCEYKCDAGRCIDQDVGDICVDTDKGINIYEKGVISQEDKKFEDYCIDKNILFEFDCGREYVKESTHKGLGGEEYKCANGCKDGKCTLPLLTDEKISEKCEDSDGENIWNKGFVKSETEMFQDYCINSIYLYEFKCGDKGIESRRYECEFGCKGGKCRQSYKLDDLTLDNLNKVLEKIVNRFVAIEGRLDKVESVLGILGKEEAIPETEPKIDSDRITELCGNGICDEGEDAASCPSDCERTELDLASCGDGFCDPRFENSKNCRIDCGPTKDYIRDKIKAWLQGLA
ncbi:MAG: hypothetical protein U9Q69_00120 [Nanoarchaeota archaeon]|nr:hypothetical protein [Nanoarchaeota archaeon]